MKKSRKADKIHSIHRQPYCTPTDLAVSHRNPQSPRHEIFFLLYESKGSLVEKGYISQNPRPQSEREEQGPCCHSKHLPLCGRPFRPIVVQKLVVLPSGPEACGGPPCCSGFIYVVAKMRGPGYHHHWLWPFAPFLKHSMIAVFFFPHPLGVVHFLRTLAGQHSFSFLSPPFVLLLSFGVYAYCFSEHLIIHMVIF